MLDFELLQSEPLKYWMLLISMRLCLKQEQKHLDLKQTFIRFTVTVGFVLNLVDMIFSFSCKKEAKFKWMLGFTAFLSYFGHDTSL